MIYEILDAQGNVENTIVADEQFMQANYPAGSYRLVPDAASPEPAPEDRRITKLAFRNRFTKAERAGIEFAALDDPTAPIAQRQQAAALRADLKNQEQATYIDLDDEDTRTGVLTLKAVGLIAAGRAVEILDAPVQDGERFAG
jgi:hypothetical protein